MRTHSTLLIMAVLALPACGKANSNNGSGAAKPGDKTPAKLSGTVKVDGSSTVFPISEGVAEEFGKKNGGVRATVGSSGTGGGFKKFCAGETDISDASRPIKPSEVALCAKNNVEYIEIPIAYDGIAIVVNPKADWVDHLTVFELKKMWAPEAKGVVMKWSDVRAGWPEKDLHLFGAGTDSGTYDYFTDAIVGKEHSSRPDYQPSEDDNVLVQGVLGDVGALGFFGLAYYEENKDKLKLVPVDDGKPDNGDGPILPSLETVTKGTYQPLARPLFIYVAKKSLDKPEVAAFIDFYLTEGTALVKEVGYIPLSQKAYELGAKRAADRKTGSLFEGKGSQVGVTIEDLLAKEQGTP
jgi:phosphate transport system substrate-binding protein